MATLRVVRPLLFLLIALTAIPMLAQQTGAISGKVTTDGAPLPGVTVEARSNVLPQPRVTVTDANGEYRLPALQPGTYTLTFSLSGMQTMTRTASANVGQTTHTDVAMGVEGISETITVTAESTLVDRQSTEIESSISSRELASLPL